MQNFDGSNELFVQNIDKLSELSLLTFFKNYGVVANVDVAKDSKTGKSKGFAFVAFDSVAAVGLALRDGNEAEVSYEIFN